MNFNENLLLIIISVLLGSGLTFVVQLILHKIKKDKLRPEVTISPAIIDGTIFAEINNIGEEDILELTVIIKWLQGKKVEERRLSRFFWIDQSPITDASTTISFLGIKEKVRAADIPQITDDNIVKVIVAGLGVKSKKPLHKIEELKIPARPGLY